MMRIAITGPESTGKSQLASELALHYNSEWVAEFAREYLLKNGASYSMKDVETIALEQLKREQKPSLTANDFIFYDTDLLVCFIWMEHAFGNVPDWLIHAVDVSNFDHTFLMNVDLPWQPDPLREHPDKREFLFNRYEQELIRLGRNYTVVSGTGEARIVQAIQELDKLMFADG